MASTLLLGLMAMYSLLIAYICAWIPWYLGFYSGFFFLSLPIIFRFIITDGAKLRDMTEYTFGIGIISLLLGGFYLFSDYYFLMQSSYSFSIATYNFKSSCYQEREIYRYFKNQLISDEDSAVGVIYGPKGIGKTTFLKQLANNNPGVFYYEITVHDIKGELFQKFLEKLFIGPGYHPVAWLYEIQNKILMVKRPNFSKFQDLFNSESTSAYFEKSFGRTPVFIFDNINILQKSESGMEELLDFAKSSLTNNYFQVILAGSEGWTPDCVSKHFDMQRLNSLQLLSEFTEEESYNFHKCLRKMDSEEIIKKTYSLIKGHPGQYRFFARLADNYPDPLSEDNYVKIINKLLGAIRTDFEKSSINFNQIYKNMIKDLKKKSSILTSIKWMNLLINNNGPLPETSFDELIDDEIMSGNIFKKYSNFLGNYLIDFQTNLHRVYASINMGYFNGTEYEVEWTFEQFKDSLKKNYGFEI